MAIAKKICWVTLGLIATLWVVLSIVDAPPLPNESASGAALFDADGALSTLSLSTDEKYRLYLPEKEISPALKQATLQYEDKFFFTHPGVNPYSLIRGAISTLLAPSRPIGGSTLTMQVARLVLGLKTRSFAGKLQQIFWALVLERHYTKNEILEAYLNLAPYGANVEGAGAASLVYFRKEARKLTLSEAITLAVLPQHPAKRWKNSGQEELDAARARLVGDLGDQTSPHSFIPRDLQFTPADVPQTAPHLFSRLHALYPAQLELRTTLDSELQQATADILRNSVDRFADFGIENGTILVAELPDMKVRAYVGSASYLNRTIDGFVNGLRAPRSPGSLLKPFVYALAIDQGQIVPDTMLQDVPIRLASYRPENFERNFVGPISATDALIRSRNIPALELFRTLEPRSFYKFLGEAGVGRLEIEDHYGIALVLGGLGTSAEEIAQLYGVLGNGGTWRALQFLDGETPPVTERRLLSPEAAFLVTDMLSKNPPALVRASTGPLSSAKRIPWKTGTSYGSKDAWAAGIVGSYVVVVWLGNFDGKPNPNLVGRDFAGPVFFSMVDQLRSRLPYLPSNPSSLHLKRVELCALSGAIAGPDCPHRKMGWFIPGVSPIQSCEIHHRAATNPETGLRLCPGEAGGTEKVFELWDSGMLDLFERAGLRRNTLPPFEDRCGITTAAVSKIRIVTPEEHVDYYLETHRKLELELRASVPGDSKQVSWFVDDVLVGQSEPSIPIHWSAKVGRFELRAVDDRGRSSVVNIRVRSQVEG